jgi:hypothetical protein
MNTTTATETDIHTILLTDKDTYRREHYGIHFTSAFVYTVRGSSPIRIAVWDNVRRPNPRNGEPVRYSNYGKIDGGEGRYLDPNNNATDDEVSYLLSPEASCISAHGDSTGTVASGQVYDAAHERLRAGEIVRLAFPDGSVKLLTVTPEGHYGHGRLIPVAE